MSFHAIPEGKLSFPGREVFVPGKISRRKFRFRPPPPEVNRSSPGGRLLTFLWSNSAEAPPTSRPRVRPEGPQDALPSFVLALRQRPVTAPRFSNIEALRPPLEPQRRSGIYFFLAPWQRPVKRRGPSNIEAARPLQEPARRSAIFFCGTTGATSNSAEGHSTSKP